MSDLEKTYREEKPRLLNWLSSRLETEEDPEDVLQEIFERAARVTHPIENLVAWLYASARNAVVDAWRRREKTPLSLDGAEWDSNPEGLIRETLIPGPEEAYRRKEILEVLNEAIEDLPEEQQEIFLLQAIEGYSFKEAAETLEISINTAMSRKRYAVEKLRERLGDYRDIITGEKK